MFKALILAYDFPPYVSVGGLRPYSWYKELSEYNIYPIVITRQWSNDLGNELDYISPSKYKNTIIKKTEKGTLIKTKYEPTLSNKLLLKYGNSKFVYFRKILSLLIELKQHLFFSGQKSYIYKEAHNFLKKYNVDIIIATSEPFVLFKYADKLSREFKTPWLADYRDPWTQDNSRYDKLPFLKVIDIIFEKKYLSSTQTITTPNNFFKAKLSNLFPNKKVNVIYNGFDSSSIDQAKNIPQTSDKLTMAYIGTICDWHPIEIFLKVCEDFTKKHDNPLFVINFIGINNENKVKQLLNKKYQLLLKFVNFTPKLSNEKLVQKLAEQNVLILFNYYSNIGTKLFDYMAIKRQILFCFTEDSEAENLKKMYYNFDESLSQNKQIQAEIINKTNSGIVVKNSYKLMIHLEELYCEFISKKFIQCNSNDIINQFSRKAQTEQLAILIKQLLN